MNHNLIKLKVFYLIKNKNKQNCIISKLSIYLNVEMLAEQFLYINYQSSSSTNALKLSRHDLRSFMIKKT